MLQTLQCFIREAAIGFYRAKGMSVVTVGIITASLVIPGGFLLLMENLKALADEWDRVQIHAYFHDEAVDSHPEDVDAFVEQVRSRRTVQSARYISREEALSIFRSSHANLAGAADSLKGNPFPASIEISLAGEGEARRGDAEKLMAMIRDSDLVESVQDNEEEARRLSSLLSLISTIGLGIGTVLAAASTFIIFNVIRLTVNARRDEITVMRLVGATSGFIRGPFLFEGMIQGGLGALLAIVVLWAAHIGVADYAERSGSSLASLMSARFLPTMRTLSIAAAGLLIGLIGSALSLGRYLIEEKR